MNPLCFECKELQMCLQVANIYHEESLFCTSLTPGIPPSNPLQTELFFARLIGKKGI